MPQTVESSLPTHSVSPPVPASLASIQDSSVPFSNQQGPDGSVTERLNAISEIDSVDQRLHTIPELGSEESKQSSVDESVLRQRARLDDIDPEKEEAISRPVSTDGI